MTIAKSKHRKPALSNAARRRRPLTGAERQRLHRLRKAARNIEPFLHRDAVLELLESMPRVVPSHDGPYTFQDRARDFIEVFNSDAGRRVLSQIHMICDPPPRLDDADKPGTLAAKMGMRRVMAELMLCFVVKKPVTIQRSSNVDSNERPGSDAGQ